MTPEQRGTGMDLDIFKKRNKTIDEATIPMTAGKHDIIELAYIIVSGDEIFERQILMQPFNYDNISPSALEINNRTIEEIKGFMPPKAAYGILIADLNQYVDKYDKRDKLKPCGHNAKFDTDFLRDFLHVKVLFGEVIVLELALNFGKK